MEISYVNQKEITYRVPYDALHVQTRHVQNNYSAKWSILTGSSSSGVYICKSIVNYLRHGNYICKSEGIHLSRSIPLNAEDPRTLNTSTK